MLDVEVRINGNLIAVTKIIRQGWVAGDKHKYIYKHINLEHPTIEIGEVEHSYKNGFATLVKKVMDDVEHKSGC